jgi:hypothetical protein
MIPDQIADVRTLLAPSQFADVTATVLGGNPGMDGATAAGIVSDALAFVVTAARNPKARIAPSRTVDEGWHALILHTALYAELCERLGGFVHHYPERPDPARQKSGVLDHTVTLMRATGHQPDMKLWTLPDDGSINVAAECGHAPTCGPIEPIPGLVPALVC